MDIMYFVMDAHSFYNFIYFILLIIVSGCGLSWADLDSFKRALPDLSPNRHTGSDVTLCQTGFRQLRRQRQENHILIFFFLNDRVFKKQL